MGISTTNLNWWSQDFWTINSRVSLTPSCLLKTLKDWMSFLSHLCFSGQADTFVALVQSMVVVVKVELVDVTVTFSVSLVPLSTSDKWCMKHKPHGCFLKWWYPQIIHSLRVFHYFPSILGYPYFCKHPHGVEQIFSWPLQAQTSADGKLSIWSFELKTNMPENTGWWN